ncbi:hypothetical protein D9613_009607 [Agrocybe pediades]|uniref:DUF6534 domain-containing protein n=1 Tax=Agrocybe pediades TaxID=84607 RepID=A0A8H4R4G7_9AGAR|nr:hypothetical protein D9613_009607 [Agrocybe pediades]
MATVDYLLYISFAAAVASDSLVAISLCSLLFWSRTGIKRTDSILTILMAFTINTGLLTSICAMACLITYAIWPQRFIFMGLYFALSKLYVNSLLASLNARRSLRNWDNSEPTSLNEIGHAQRGGRGTSIAFPVHMRRTDGTNMNFTNTGGGHTSASTGVDVDGLPFLSMTKQQQSFMSTGTDAAASMDKDRDRDREKSASVGTGLTARTSATLDERERRRSRQVDVEDGQGVGAESRSEERT